MKLPDPVAWHTEDHLTDRSATTYSKDMVYRWQCKGWPVTPMYSESQLREALAQQEAVMRQALDALNGLFGIPEQGTGQGGGGVAVWRLGGSDQPCEAIKALEEVLK